MVPGEPGNPDIRGRGPVPQLLLSGHVPNPHLGTATQSVRGRARRTPGSTDSLAIPHLLPPSLPPSAQAQRAGSAEVLGPGGKALQGSTLGRLRQSLCLMPLMGPWQKLPENGVPPFSPATVIPHQPHCHTTSLSLIVSLK